MASAVTVLGAGIVGICTALELAERGHTVRVIDRKPPGQETSYGNAGVISPWSVVPQSAPGILWQVPRLMTGPYKPLSVHPKSWPRMIGWGLQFLRNGRETRVRRISDAMSILCGPSVDLYRRHLSAADSAHLIRDSIYVHAFRDGAKARLDSLDYALRREKGAELEVIGADALRRLEPALSREFEAAVLVHGQARAVSPGRICEVLADRAARQGVTFETEEVRALKRDGERWVVVCQGARFPASSVVIAMGVWSRALLQSLGLSVPLMAERGYHVEYADPQITVAHSVSDVDAKIVASSMEQGVRIAGQAEFAPIDAPPDRHKFRRLRKIAQSLFPDLAVAKESQWMGRRPSFPDSLPAIGPIRGHAGLYANFGHSHYGLMMAPKSAQLLAACVERAPQNEDITAFSPDRFR